MKPLIKKIIRDGICYYQVLDYGIAIFETTHKRDAAHNIEGISQKETF